jgi:long-chain acyl-CoA synthetase
MSTANPPVFETLVELYEHATTSYADRPLFGQKKGGEWKWMTYGEFREKTEGFRAGLAAIGVGRGDKVTIISDNRPEWAIAYYACAGLGAALVPMYEAQVEKDWEYIIEDSSSKVLIVASKAILEKTKPFLQSIATLKHIVCIEDVSGAGSNVSSFSMLAASDPKVPSIKPTTKDVVCLIYTSGTTGKPKGVILSHGNIASNVSAVHLIFPIDQDDRSLSFLPWAHSFGQTCELHALMSAGASMGLAESVPKIVENLAEVHPTLLFSVPRIFNKIYASVQKQISDKPELVRSLVRAALDCTAKERAGQRLSVKEHLTLSLADTLVFSKVREKFGGKLKYAFSGGAAISKEVAEFVDSLGVTVYEGYGLTETSPITTANAPGMRKIGSIGRPIPGVRVEIDSNVGHGEKRPGKVEGEIIVYGPNVMQGYHNKPEENAQVFTKDGGFRTGDQGYIDPQGFVHITGRIKEQYKLENGKYVVPTPLEEHLKLSQYVLNAFVFGDNKPYNVALVVANIDAVKQWAQGAGIGSLPAEQLLEHPRVRELFKKEVERYSEAFKGFEEIKDFAIIGEDFTTENGLLTPSLKVKRRKVVEKYQAVLDKLYARKAPRSEASAEARA